MGVGCPLAPPVIDRQPERRQQGADFLLRGGMGEARTGAQHRHVERIERGEPAREELAIDRALGKSIEEPEAEQRGERFQRRRDDPLVAGDCPRQAVAHHDPVRLGSVQRRRWCTAWWTMSA